jgi:hypothetical protein
MSAHEFFSASPSTNKSKNYQRKENAGPMKSDSKHCRSNDAFFEEEEHCDRERYDAFSASSSDTVESLDYSIPSLLEEEEERQILKNEGDLRNHRVVFLRGVDGCASAVLVPIKDHRAAELDEEPELEDEPIVQPLFHDSRALFHSSQEMMTSSREESESDSEPSITEDIGNIGGNECCFFQSLTLILSKLFGKKESSLLPNGDYKDFPTQLPTVSAPLFQSTSPIGRPSGPFVLSSGPFFQTSGPVFPSSIPAFPTAGPLFHSPSPIFQNATDPAVHASRPVVQHAGPSFRSRRTSMPSGGYISQRALLGKGASRLARGSTFARQSFR